MLLTPSFVFILVLTAGMNGIYLGTVYLLAQFVLGHSVILSLMIPFLGFLSTLHLPPNQLYLSLLLLSLRYCKGI